MRIGHLDTAERVIVIAEAGNNHEGDEDIAAALVHAAAEAGADAVKFQTFRTELYVSAGDAERFARLRSFELSYEAFTRLAELARSLGLLFLSTPFDLESVRFLAGIVDALKVASGDNDFVALLDVVADTHRPVLVSTGASDLARAESVVARIRGRWGGDDHGLALLHCVSAYPTPEDEANVAAVRALARMDAVPGYSDHTVGNDAAVLSVAAGARIVEKHLTLDHHQSDFRDHQLSAEPQELADLVARVRDAEMLLGSGEKVPQPAEAQSAQAIRRSIVAGRDLAAGETVRFDDLTWIRPAGGLPPGSEDALVGKTLRRDVAFGERLQLDDVE